MTSTNGSDRLDRMEALLQETIKITQANSQAIAKTTKLAESNSRDIAETRQAIAETRQAIAETRQAIAETNKLAESNGRTIQGMLSQRATDRLKHEEQLEQQRQLNSKLILYIEGLGNMLVKLDEEKPTILRKLNTIENKVDKLDKLDRIENKIDRIIEEK